MSTLSGRRLAPHLLIGLILPILAGADEGKNWQRLRSMPRERRVALADKIREFDRLGGDQKAAIRAIDEKIAALPPAEQSHYREVLRRYHLWLQTLSEQERTRLVQAPSSKEKLALMVKLRDEQRKGKDPAGTTALLFQLADLRGRSPFEVAQMLRVWFALSPADRAEIEKLGVRDRMKRLFELARAAKAGPISQLSKQDEEATSKQLDELLEPRNWLRNQLKKDSERQAIDRRRLLNNYYFVANPPKPVSAANLLRFEAALPSWIRTTFDHLAPEEARRRLTILYRLIYPPDTEMPSSAPRAQPGAGTAAPPPEPPKAPAPPRSPSPSPVPPT